MRTDPAVAALCLGLAIGTAGHAQTVPADAARPFTSSDAGSEPAATTPPAQPDDGASGPTRAAPAESPPALAPAARSDTVQPSTPSARVVTGDEPSPRPVRRGRGRLRIAVNRPNTRVFIDGVAVGTAPLERDLLPGPHTIRLQSPGQKPWRGGVQIIAGMLTPLRAFLRPTLPRESAWITAITSGVIFTGGTIAGVLSNRNRAALDAERAAGRLDNRDPRIDQGTAFAALADGAFVLGAVVASLAIFMFAHDNTAPSAARIDRRRTLPVEP